MQVSAIDYHVLADREDAAYATALPTLQTGGSVFWLKDSASLAEAAMHLRCPLTMEQGATDSQDDGTWREVPSLDKLIADASCDQSSSLDISHVTLADSGQLGLVEEWRAGEDDPPFLEEPKGLSLLANLMTEEEQTSNPWQLPTEMLASVQADGLVVEDSSCCQPVHSWLDSILLGGIPGDRGLCSANSLPETADFNVDLEADLDADRVAFETSGALPAEARSWLSVPAAGLLPTLSDLNLGSDARVPLATSTVCVSLPDNQDLLASCPLVHPSCGAAAGGTALAMECDAASNQAVCPPEITEDDPDVVDWSAGSGLPLVCLMDLGVATLPSLWELEGIVERRYEWPHPDSCLFGASRPALLSQTLQKQLSEMFEGSCWRLGHKQLEIPSFPVPDLASKLPMSHEATVLLQEDGRSGASLSLGFAGAIARTSFLSSCADQYGASEFRCSQTELKESDFDELLLNARGAVADDELMAKASSLWQGMPQSSLADDKEASFSLDEGLNWPPDNQQAQPSMMKLKVFQKLGPLPLSLVSNCQRVTPLKAKKVQDAKPGPHIEPNSAQQVGRNKDVDGASRRKCKQHFYNVSPKEAEFILQLQGDMELVWATYFSYVSASGSEDASMPDSSAIQALLRQHTEEFLHAKESGADATDKLDLYRILLALHVLQTIHEELTSSGILQAVFCADAFLTRFPSWLLSGNMWTHQAITKLHSTVGQVCEANSIAPEIRDIIELANTEMTYGGTPKHFCAYAKCSGCGPSSLTLAECTKASQLPPLAKAAAGRGRWLVVVFSSQCILEAVCRCCWRFGDGQSIVLLPALMPLQQSAQQIYAAGYGLVLAHETALGAPCADGLGSQTDSLSAENIIAHWEICRLLQQHCTVVSYQPLTMSAIDSLVDVRLTMQVSVASTTPSGPQSVPAGKEAAARQPQVVPASSFQPHSREQHREAPGMEAERQQLPRSLEQHHEAPGVEADMQNVSKAKEQEQRLPPQAGEAGDKTKIGHHLPRYGSDVDEQRHVPELRGDTVGENHAQDFLNCGEDAEPHRPQSAEDIGNQMQKRAQQFSLHGEDPDHQKYEQHLHRGEDEGRKPSWHLEHYAREEADPRADHAEPYGHPKAFDREQGVPRTDKVELYGHQEAVPHANNGEVYRQPAHHSHVEAAPRVEQEERRGHQEHHSRREAALRTNHGEPYGQPTSYMETAHRADHAVPYGRPERYSREQTVLRVEHGEPRGPRERYSREEVTPRADRWEPHRHLDTAAHVDHADLPKFHDTRPRSRPAWMQQDIVDNEFSNARTAGHAPHNDRVRRREPSQQRDIWADDFTCTPRSETTLHERRTPEGKSSSRGRLPSLSRVPHDAPKPEKSRSERRRSEQTSAWNRIPATNLTYHDVSSSSAGKYSSGRGEKRRHPDGGYGMFGALRRAEPVHAPVAHHVAAYRSTRSSSDGSNRMQMGKTCKRSTSVRFDPWADQD